MNQNFSPEDINKLTQAFETFSSASASLEIAYEKMAQKVAHLENKLAAAHVELQKNYEEKTATLATLQHIQSEITFGVMYADNKGSLPFINQWALDMMEIEKAPHEWKKLPDAWRGVIKEVVLTRKALSGEFGNSQGRILRWQMRPVEAQGVVGLVHDITDEVQAQQADQRRARLLAMGEMAAEIAHEIRNPLGGISLMSSLLYKEWAGTKNGQLIQAITEGIDSINGIVSNMLLYARPMDPAKTWLDENQVNDMVAQWLDGVAEKNKVTWQIQGEGRIWADPELIRQVLLNLLLNSIQAMDRSTQRELNVFIKTSDETNEGILEVSDTGKGMSQEVMSQLFTPYFTAKKGGTGLGLAVVQRIVQNHKGHIEVSSKPGSGTTLTILLPNPD